MAVERLGVDAAIILADLLPIIIPMGFHLEYIKGVGPVIDNPVRTGKDLDRIIDSDASELQYVYDALSIVRKALRPDIALIGFCGAPFTVASYIIEGGKSNDYAHTKSLMHSDEIAWHDLMQRLVKISIDYLTRQIDAGANAVQVFDSWVGTLSPQEYEKYVQPHVVDLINAAKTKGAPVIHFATDCTDLLPLIKATGCDVVGVDWRINLEDAWSLLDDDQAIMGNLDPQVLLKPPSQIRAAAKAVLDQADGRPGHIFNLGHGISPDMPFEHVAELVAIVHELSKR